MVSKKQTESKARSTYSKLNTLKARREEYHNPATIAELAEFMECNQRTIFRYFNTLKKENCGFHVTKDDPYRYFIQKETVKRPDPVVKILETVDSNLSAADGGGQIRIHRFQNFHDRIRAFHRFLLYKVTVRIVLGHMEPAVFFFQCIEITENRPLIAFHEFGKFRNGRRMMVIFKAGLERIQLRVSRSRLAFRLLLAYHKELLRNELSSACLQALFSSLNFLRGKPRCSSAERKRRALRE